MTILDAASGGMTFERYIRTTKESLIEDEYKVVVELLEEYTGQIYAEEKSRVKTG